MSVAADRCPDCGAEIPRVAGFQDWCEHCGWNLNPPDVEAGGWAARVYAAAGRRAGTRLIDELLGSGRLEPRWTPGKIAAYLIAILVHLITVGAAVAGIALIALTWLNIGTIVVGLALIGVAVLMRPRFGEVPEKGILTREEAPELYDLVDDIAGAIDTRPADLIVVNGEYNAWWATLGLRRRRVLALGLPLLAVLDPQEQVALIAHELAHGRNGDATRGLGVGSAIDALEELRQLFVSGRGTMDRSNFAILEWLTRPILWALSRPIVALLYIEVHLLYRDKQRAEFLADALAAKAAGGPGAVGLHEKFLLESTFTAVVHQAAHGRDDDLFGVLRTAVEAVPERERERRRRLARLERTRLDATHPPTSHRIRVVEAQVDAPPLVVLDAARVRRIDDEVADRRRAIADELVDSYRASLYAY
jgi:Zn-dependent protease with chaperone function